MNNGKNGAPFARTPEFNNRKLLRNAVAGVLAAGALIAVSAAEARIVSVTMNPPGSAPDTDGAASGILMLKAGQKIHFNCHITYTDERAKSEGAPLPAENGTLRFANEAFTAEMCILFGSTTNVSLLSPTKDTSKLPDFAIKP